MKKPKNRKPGRGRVVECVIGCVLFSLACLVIGACTWVKETFALNFQQILYTLSSPLEGTDMGIVVQGVKACVPELCLIAVFLAVSITVCVLQKRMLVTAHVVFFRWKFQCSLLKVIRHLLTAVSVVTLAAGLWYADKTLAIVDYVKQYLNATTIYEDSYVDPATVHITAPEKKKNLIYIYLESMETTYASEDVGGRQEINYIPNLTELARENCSFSDSEQLGGWHSCQGTTWTMGALFATTSGIPFAFPPGFNAMNKYQYFASGCTTLGDVLEDNGYHNVFLCGSDASFAGRRKYFEQHGDYTIYDLFTAREEGYIPADYKVWWGYEDEILYKIAKDKLTMLAESDQPFNFTMLTVDTHHINGYVCSRCRDTYDSITANVVDCADRQVGEFLQWCSQQDFFEDTVIIVTGDHPRMDSNLVENVDYYDRTVYNCILNCSQAEGARTQNRTFTAMDMFPTVLSALDFTFDGDQLGLGVDMFSGSDTMAEAMGYDSFEAEISKYSPYYISHFS